MDLRYYVTAHGRTPLVEWLDALRDLKARARIAARLVQLAQGNFGDLKTVGDGVQELRIHHGPGYRVYVSRQGVALVLLLCASNKADQPRAIEQAKAYLIDWKARKDTS